MRPAILASPVLAAAWLAVAPPARAQDETEHLLHVDLHGGAMVTDDQRQLLRLDREGAAARVVGGLRPVEWLAGELSLGATVVGGRDGAGGVLDASLGLRLMPRIDRFTPFVSVAAGVGLTGLLVLPVLHGTAGFWLDVAGEWSIGPELAVTHVVWADGPQQTSDAVFVAGGLSVAFRPTHALPAPPAAVRTTHVVHERTRVVVRASGPTLPVPPPADPEELLRLVDRAVPAVTTRSITTLVPPLLFEHDRTELSSCGEASVHDLRARIAAAPATARFVIEGHADATGDDGYNDALALRRAAAVRDVLVAQGVDSSRIELRSAGEGEPLVDRDDARALSVNRRVVVHVLDARTDTSGGP